MTEIHKNEIIKPTLTGLEGILSETHRLCMSFGEKEREIVNEGSAFGDLVSDTEIQADKAIAESILGSFRKLLPGIPFVIEIEGLGRFEENQASQEQAKYYITVDPLDGSLNYRLKGETLGLPYSAIIAIFDRANPKFKDALMAGCIDLRNGDTWLAERGKGCSINGKKCETSKRVSPDIKNGIIIGEFYYPENRELLLRIFSAQKGWLRNPGSAAYEMSLVASSQADAFICDRQKSHELGASYLLVTEAGGYVCDIEGNDLAEREYQFNSQVPVILAASKDLALDLVSRIRASS